MKEFGAFGLLHEGEDSIPNLILKWPDLFLVSITKPDSASGQPSLVASRPDLVSSFVEEVRILLFSWLQGSKKWQPAEEQR